MIQKKPDSKLVKKQGKFPTCSACDLELRTPDAEQFHRFECKWIAFCPQDGPQTFALTRAEKEIYFGGAVGGSKALALDTPIPTPSGWSYMGDLEVGQKVFDDEGYPCSITAVSPIMYGHKCYRIRFNDGQEVVADAGHRWLTFDYSEREKLARRHEWFRVRRRAKRPSRATGSGLRPWVAAANSARRHEYLGQPTGTIRTTEEIAKTVVTGKRKVFNHGIRVCPGLKTKMATLPIDPFVLGAWLGDGESNAGRLTTNDPEMVEEISRRGFPCKKQKAKFIYNIVGLHSKLRVLGLKKNKHIPEIYLRSAPSQRLDLLRGLMDTDGTCTASGASSFTSTNRILAEGVAELMVSLGIKCSIRGRRAMLYGKDCGPVYSIKVNTAKKLFLLPRKLARVPDAERRVQGWRIITSVQEVASVPVRCISVDSPSHLFLAGRGMIPTHNTTTQIGWFLRWAIARDEKGDIKYPNFRGAVIRVEYSYLKDWIDKAAAIYGKVYAKAVGNPVEFRFPDGPIVRTGHLGDWQKYQGWEIHKLGIDELNQVPLESTYEMLSTRVRASPDGNPQIFATGNPGGAGDYWVRKRFVKLVGPDGRPWPENTPWTHPATGETRIFIPSKLADNRVLERRDASYRAKLMGLPEKKRRALLEGDYDALEGQAFEDFRAERQDGEPHHALHVVPADSLPLRPYWHRWGSVDWGFEHPSAWYKFCATPEGKIVVYAERVVARMGSFDMGRELAYWWRDELIGQINSQITIFLSKDAFSKGDDIHTKAERMAAGVESVMGPGMSFLASMTSEEKDLEARNPREAKAIFEARLAKSEGRPGIIFHPANNNRQAGANYIRECLNWREPFDIGEPNEDTAQSILMAQGELEWRRYYERFKAAKKEAAARPRLQIYGPSSPGALDGCQRLIEAIPTRIVDDGDRENVAKIDGGIGDDEYDSFYYGMLGHRDIVNAAPRDYVLAEKMDQARQVYSDPTVLDQIARYQAAKFDQAHKGGNTLTLPRAGSMRHRRLQ